jgi:type II secretory pathway component PulM
MKEWWENLGERERQLLSIGVLVLMLLLGYVFVVEPLQIQIKTATAERDAKTALLHKLESVAAEADALRAQQIEQGQLPEGAVLQTVIEESAEAAGLKERISTVSPEGADAVRLSMKSAQYDSALLWLVTLRQQYGVRVDSIDAARGGEPGTADVEVTVTAR